MSTAPPAPAAEVGGQQPEPETETASAAEQTRPSAASGPDEDSFDDVLTPVGRTGVAGVVRARTAFLGRTTIGTVVIGERRSRTVVTSDLKVVYEPEPFVPPPGHEELASALDGTSVVVCSGPVGCGRDSAVVRALIAQGVPRVLALPALTVGELTEALVSLADESPGTACVVRHLDESVLRLLAGPQGAKARALVATRHVRLVLVLPELVAPAGRALRVVEVGHPDEALVAAAHAARHDLPPAARATVLAAVGRLSAPAGPALVAAVAEEVARRPEATVDEVLAEFQTGLSDEVVAQWASDGRPVSEVAALAAGVTLSGCTVGDVQEGTQELAHSLMAGRRLPAAEPRLGGGAPSWPGGLLRCGPRDTWTHFGPQSVEVVEVCEPHVAHGLLQAQWRHLGEEFRQGYCAWLRGLAHHRRARWHAAFAAGVLFAVDPVHLERAVLGPWSRADQAYLRRCAGTALGVPLVIGSDPTASRALASSWSRSTGLAQRRSAVAAFAGWLGAWDVESCAPAELLQLGEAVELRADAERGLAQLVVAGAEADQARAVVLEYLLALAEERRAAERAYRCAALVVERLTARHPTCVASLRALEAEPESLARLAELTARALTAPTGTAYGRSAVTLLVRAVARGHTDQEWLEQFVRSMKRQIADPERRARLGGVLRRSLAAQARSAADAAERETAVALSTRFFHNPLSPAPA